MTIEMLTDKIANEALLWGAVVLLFSIAVQAVINAVWGRYSRWWTEIHKIEVKRRIRRMKRRALS